MVLTLSLRLLGSGSTTSSVVSSEVKTHSGNISVPQITVKEDVSRTFTTEGGTVKVKANGPYKFKAGTVTLKSGVNAAIGGSIALSGLSLTVLTK